MLRKIHLIAGVLGLIVFVLQGQYMDIVHGHLATMQDAPRMLYRSSHIYLLLVSVLNVVLGVYRIDPTLPFKRVVQCLLSSVALLAPLALLLGFFVEPGLSELARPYSRPALYALFGIAVLLSVVGFANWRKR